MHWTAENLNIEIEGSLCFQNTVANCDSEGHLYNWQAARTVCAKLGSGWRLPTDQDWRTLTRNFGGAYGDGSTEQGHNAYAVLAGNGSRGFNGSFGGKNYWFPDRQEASFYDFGKIDYYWVDALEGSDRNIARIYTFRSSDRSLSMEVQTTQSHGTVRCVKNSAR